MAVINRARWKQLEPLLDVALELSDEERVPWLEALRSRSPDLADELTSILSGESVADRQGFLSDVIETPLVGLTLRGYTLEKPLGHGGMGSVWLARRTDGQFEGVAAVKVLNLALLTATGQARFRREGSVLARLTHPGIGRLLDAGVTPAGQPYLVLEYVDGPRIDAFANEHALSRDDRIRLVLQVLSAVSHAHANLIVHRDIKPSNILVTADGTAKLLDFGIAKLITEGQLGSDAPLTADGGRVFTPEFAAPEQARGDRVTTATDVYALGVLLYLLLSGRHPTGEGCHTPAEALAALQEVEPARLELGDLDTVLSKALHKTPEQRYQSAAAFAEDLERYLRHEPVSARPDSVVYRARKFVRRHRLGLGVTTAVATLTVAYAVTVTAQRERIRAALDEATLSSKKTEQVTDFMLGLFASSDNGKALGDTVRAGDLLAHGLKRVRDLKGQPEIQAQLLEVVGRVYTQLGEYAQAEPLIREALEAGRKLRSTSGTDSARTIENLANVEMGQGNFQAELAHRQTALAVYREELGPTDPVTMNALFEVGAVLHRMGRYKEASPIMDEWARLVSSQPPETSAVRASQLKYRGDILEFSGHPEQAEKLYRDVLAIDRALYGERHELVADALENIAVALDASNRSREALPLMRDAIAMLRFLHPSGHPSLGETLATYGHILEHAGPPAEAEGPLREALVLRTRYHGPESLQASNVKIDLAYVLNMTGRYDEAERFCREALASRRAMFKADNNPMVLGANVCVADALRGQKRYADAESLLLHARELLTSGTQYRGNLRKSVDASLVRLYEAQGRVAEAEKYR